MATLREQTIDLVNAKPGRTDRESETMQTEHT
jgi:hypothetical protein